MRLRLRLSSIQHRRSARPSWLRRAHRLLALSFFWAAAACSDPGESATLTVWAHAGQPSERRVMQTLVAKFQQRYPHERVAVTFLPEGTYHAQVQAAAAAGELPDIVELDGPLVPRFVWQQLLVELDTLLPEQRTANLLPSIIEQGSFAGRLFAVGMFDSGLALYARRSNLEQHGIRIPTHPRAAWTRNEFEKILADLAADDLDGAVLDLKLNYTGEWFTYAFQPLFRSAGASLLPSAGSTTVAALDGPRSEALLRRLQRWIVEDRYVDPNTDDRAFIDGRVGVSLSGHWEYGRNSAAFGDDLLVLPLPDLGYGSKSAQGSWMWAITKASIARPRAAAFLAFLLEAEQILAMTSANGAIPATVDAIRASDRFGQDSPAHLFVTQLKEGFTVPRPRTPAYPVVTIAIQRLLYDVRTGESVGPAAVNAARRISRELAIVAGEAKEVTTDNDAQ
ncbi:MAG: carbohydrate ABC transporter substrate-binding protein [Bdellovibrionales bacterium]|nr:carbohydrate ABC transporter substrate-binding protein [Bdellovibrionales bacterium]